MKLLIKWSTLFIVVGVIVFLLTGAWYKQNVFGWLFEQKLRQELIALLYINQSKFIASINQSPKVVTIEEVDIMKNFLKDPRLADAIVVNKYGQIRWSQQTQFFGRRIDDADVLESRPLPTDAIARSYLTKSPQILPFERGGGSFVEVAFPLVSRGDIKGVVSLEVSRKELHETLASGMRRFYAGAVITIFVFVAIGGIFLYWRVVSPLRQTRETIEELSVTAPAWPGDKIGPDEIGAVERAFALFLEKLRATVAKFERGRKEVGDIEQGRWEQILQVCLPRGSAFVLDADNYVLAGHNVAHLTKSKTTQTAPGGRGDLGAHRSWAAGGSAPPAPQVPLSPRAAGSPSATDPVRSGPLGANPVTETAGAPPTGGRLHLLDFVTSTELLQLINRALERPGQIIEGNLTVDDAGHRARIMTLASTMVQEQRTIVWLEQQA